MKAVRLLSMHRPYAHNNNSVKFIKIDVQTTPVFIENLALHGFILILLPFCVD